MMLLRYVADRLRQLIILLHLYPVTGMCDNNRFAQLRIDKVMRILHIVLILDKIARTLCFSDIMIIRAYPAQ
ncbi:hypothetical protein D3C77_592450 [compost metagenome]